MAAKKLKLGPRNDPVGLARRSLENLRLIEHAYASDKEGHVVTQLVQSLLALIVIPKQKALFDRFKSWRLSDLNEERWPRLVPIRDEKNDTNTLFDVLRHMRNAVCHGHLKFYGDSKDGADSRDVNAVYVVFADCAPGQPIDWELRIEGNDLRKFVHMLEEIVFR